MIGSLLPLVIAGTLLLAVVGGLAIGLSGLGRCRRSAAWWIMTAGSLLCLASPLLAIAAAWKMTLYYQSYVAAQSAGAPEPELVPIELYYGCSMLVAFYGLMVFASGFARHGLDRRHDLAGSRAIEQGLAEMERQMALLKQGKASAVTPGPALGQGKTARHIVGATILLVCAGVGVGIWAGWTGLSSLFNKEKPLMMACLAVLGASAAGIWTGLRDLRKAHGSDDPNRAPRARPRGAGLWLMTSGALCSLVPAIGFLVLFLTGNTNLLDSLGEVAVYATALLIMPLGIVFFATGFALHGLGAVRHRDRIAELGQVRSAMEEEIARLDR